MSEGKKIVFLWVPSHMGIRGNVAVDKAANDALSLGFPSEIFQFVPYSDLRCMTRLYCKQLWQEEWSTQTGNKLFQILPDLSDPLPNLASTRKEETVLTRLHIGHCYVTHSFLLKGDDPPWCFFCDKLFSVRHFLTECADLNEERKRTFNTSILSQIFRECDCVKLFEFLRVTGLFFKI